MWVKIVYVCEVFSALACIHSIFGEKIRWNVKPIALCMSLLVIYEMANNIQNGGIFSLIAYIPVFLYCKTTFRRSILQTLTKIVWMVILLTSIEFLCLLIAADLITGNEDIRNVLASLSALVISVTILPKIRISKVQLNSWPARIFLGIALLIVSLLVLESKIIHRINMALFLLIIPALLLLLFLLVKWVSTKAEADRMKEEISLTRKMDEKYRELVDDIRIKQHGVKNHITAILSAHYTYKTYEKLVEVQDEYCDMLMQENRFSHLLQINDKVLAGFLYDKFREMEADGIEVQYKIYSTVDACAISGYHLIEILGILLDNAAESVRNKELKKIFFEVKEENGKYQFSVFNLSEYVPYEEIEKWFQKGVSSKGNNRGLGLFHAKDLCRELGCEISCRNKKEEQDNWIEFCLKIKKADSI